MNPKNSTFIVTGGSSGLGEACVRRLAEAGANLVIADINEDAGNALATELGEQATFMRTDVSDATQAGAAVQCASDQFGGLHGLINCAGIGHAEKIVHKHGTHDLDAFARVIRVNLLGTFNMIRLAADVMQHNAPNEEGERGVIISTASVAAFDGQIGQVAYSASKGGVAGMTLPIARDLARSGIRNMTIAPGLFDTPLLAGLPEKARLSLGEQVPFPSRLGRPAEYAALAHQIIENPMLNGEVIRLDGAIRMAPR